MQQFSLRVRAFIDLCLACAPIALIWLLVSVPFIVHAEPDSFNDSNGKLLGTWRSINTPRSTTKTIGIDGSYRETYRFLGARVTITGTYRVEGNQLLWIGRKLFIDRAGGDVLPPTRHVRLNEEQKATLRWKGADELVVVSDRAIVYRRLLTR